MPLTQDDGVYAMLLSNRSGALTQLGSFAKALEDADAAVRSHSQASPSCRASHVPRTLSRGYSHQLSPCAKQAELLPEWSKAQFRRGAALYGAAHSAASRATAEECARACSYKPPARAL